MRTLNTQSKSFSDISYNCFTDEKFSSDGKLSSDKSSKVSSTHPKDFTSEYICTSLGRALSPTIRRFCFRFDVSFSLIYFLWDVGREGTIQGYYPFTSGVVLVEFDAFIGPRLL